MVLRLVSGPMLEKSNRTGPLANRRKVLLTARLKVSLFLEFSTTGETGIFQKISREVWEIPGILKIFGIPGVREIFEGNVFELDYFDIFDFQHFRFNFQHFVMLF